MNISVTGAAGYIGSVLSEELVAQGHPISTLNEKQTIDKVIDVILMSDTKTC